MGLQHALVSADARLPRRQRQRVRLAQRRGQVARRTTPTACRRSSNIGPGSPTGVAFGYGAKFPAKYQDALFICDWSYGKLYAVHLTPERQRPTRPTLEEFVTGTPLPLTDVVINPKDGAMYFTIGGRKTQSGLYRVTYVGAEESTLIKLRASRRQSDSDIDGDRH